MTSIVVLSFQYKAGPYRYYDQLIENIIDIDIDNQMIFKILSCPV